MPADNNFESLRDGVRSVVSQFDSRYWQDLDQARAFPEKFVEALTKAGWLSALIPEEYGGTNLSLVEASVIMEEINRAGGNSGACHGQMYVMACVVRHGSEAQKQALLPKVASGELRMQSMAVTEPTTGSDTTQLKTLAQRVGDRYVVNGQKVWTSRLQHSDFMLLLARTTPLAAVKKRSEGLSVFLVDLREAVGKSITVRPIRNMVNHETNEIFIDNLEIPVENRIGEEGKGLKYILDGLNAERILIAAECVQFPIAKAYVNVEAASLMRYEAARLFDAQKSCGAQANMAKLLAADASWEAANVCLQTHGGFGFAAEYDIERKFRETRLYQVAPISTNLILSYIGEHVLGMPKSY
ncbi:MAG: acyl-CoA/acyl-ACP dehydrogenase [Burkholderiales bacterium]|nr:acyl-CoA/acyl-ACP dehydrogenase [Burkholderiales bacterium]